LSPTEYEMSYSKGFFCFKLFIVEIIYVILIFYKFALFCNEFIFEQS